MTCGACQFEFCWLCLKKYTHDHFRPNRNNQCGGLLFDQNQILENQFDEIRENNFGLLGNEIQLNENQNNQNQLDNFRLNENQQFRNQIVDRRRNIIQMDDGRNNNNIPNNPNIPNAFQSSPYFFIIMKWINFIFFPILQILIMVFYFSFIYLKKQYDMQLTHFQETYGLNVSRIFVFKKTLI